MFGCDLQITADVVLHQFFHVLGRADREVVAQARRHQYFLDAGQGTRAPVELDQRRVAGVEIRADVRIDAGRTATRRFDLDALAALPVHVGGGAADVRDHAGETGHGVADALDLADDGIFGAALDDAALVLGDRAERAAAETAAHDLHTEADHLVGGDVRVAVARVRPPRVRQIEYAVHLLGGELDGRRIDPDIAFAVALHQRAGVAGVGLEVQHARGMGIKRGISLHRIARRHADHAARAVVLGLAALKAHDLGAVLRRGLIVAIGGAAHRVGIDGFVDPAWRIDLGGVALGPAFRQAAAPHERSAAHVGDGADRFAFGEAMGDVDDLPLGIAVDQQVGLRIEQHRAPHRVRPVIVVGEAAQARRDAADQDRHGFVGFARTLRINRDGAVGTLAGGAVRRVGVVRADLAVGGVAVDHGVHVAAGDAEEQVRPAEPHEIPGAGPIRLGEDADPEPLRLERAADHRHAEARMIDVGVARHDDDVAAVPAELLHFRTRHRQERRGAEAFGPIFPVGKQVGGVVGGVGCHDNYGVTQARRVL